MLGDVVRPAASSTVAPLAQVAVAAVALAQPDRGVGAREAGSGDDFETSEEALPARGRQALARLAALARPQRSPASSNSSLESDDEHVFTGTVDAQPQPVASAGRASSAVAVAPPRHGERAASAHELAAFRAEWAAAGVPERVEGVAVRVEARVRVDGSFVYIRRRVQCSNPAHGPQCQRSRSVFVTADEGAAGLRRISRRVATRWRAKRALRLVEGSPPAVQAHAARRARVVAGQRTRALRYRSSGLGALSIQVCAPSVLQAPFAVE